MKTRALLFGCALLVSLVPSHSATPTFAKVEAQYSATEAPPGFETFCAKHNNPKPNTCAIRLASALQKNEPKFFDGQTPKSGVVWSGLPTRAADLAIILNATLGKAQTVKNQRTALDRTRLAGKPGIIFFDTLKESDGSGHISLWDGAKVVDGGEYFDRSPRIYFWSLP